LKSAGFPQRVAAQLKVKPSVGRTSPAEASQPIPSAGKEASAGSAHSAVQKSEAASQLKVPSAKLFSKLESKPQLIPGAAVVVGGAAVLDAGGAAVVEAGAVVDAAAENAHP